ncbi:MAG: glutamate-5-semialdehyde dehydrogenase [Ruthenibacterium sp.]
MSRFDFAAAARPGSVRASVHSEDATGAKSDPCVQPDTAALLAQARGAKAAAGLLDTAAKNALLHAMAHSLMQHTDTILAANVADLAAARGSVPDVMLDRLLLTAQRVADMADGIRAVAALPDPVGTVDGTHPCENGLVITKTRVPMGVIAMIYESRPNVTADAAALCLKSGNVCVLRGGREAIRSNGAIVDALHAALRAQGLPAALVNLVTDTSRESAAALMTARGFVDLLIPRGGAGLIRACVENATVPCIETGTGICHIYVDKDADLEMALRIVQNAKMSRPSVCNAAEVCLVHADIAHAFLPRLAAQLCGGLDAAAPRAQLRCDARAYDILAAAGLANAQDKSAPADAAAFDADAPQTARICRAGEKDFDTEFLDYILAVGVVDSLQEATAHIARHSTGHSESILTKNTAAADFFTRTVDSAAVYVNASTRFTDGGVFGLGCEIGISTQKLGARGPMGLREMTTYQYIVHGNGQVR